MENKRTYGYWIMLMMGILLLVMLLLGQTLSFICYELTVSLGLQEAREIVGEMGVAVNKGFGVGDTVIYLPLLALGLIGIVGRKRWGITAMTGALAITAYWPMVCLFILVFAKDIPDFHFTRYASYALLLLSITVYGLWGLWYLYAHPTQFTPEDTRG